MTETFKSSTEHSWIPRIAFGVAAGTLAVYAIAAGPEVFRTAKRLEAEQIQQEDRAFCEKFQALPGSESYATCVTGLTAIRQRQRDRVVAESIGLL